MSLNDSEKTARQLLQNTKGRITPIRLQTVLLLLSSDSALNHQTLEKRAIEQGLNIDRVTLYRTLDWLIEQGIAHKINSVDRHCYYSIQANSQHPHAHFHCKKCQQVFCLKTSAPVIDAPPEYWVEQAELTLQGFCPQCQ